jgi:hypothetical protein
MPGSVTLKSPHQRIPAASWGQDAQAEIRERDSRLDRLTAEGVEAATSAHLLRMIDFFFALVLGQGVLRFADVLKEPWGPESNLQVVLALVLVYYTVIRSFVAWHIAMERRRYRIEANDPDTAKTTELWRVYIDLFIVVTYAFLLLQAERLAGEGNADSDIKLLFFGLALLFVLYWAWGYLRRVAWGPDQFSFRWLLIFGTLYLLLALVYTTDDPLRLGVTRGDANLISLALALVLMVAYRYVNFSQGDEERRRIGKTGMPRPRLPRLTAPGRASPPDAIGSEPAATD